MYNILYISHFPDLKMGGQQSMYNLIKNIDRDNFRPFAIVPKIGELSIKLEEIGCRVFVVELLALKPKYLFKNISNILKIRRIIRENDIAIIHPDHERDSIICGLAKFFTNTKMVWHVRLTRRVETDYLSYILSDKIIGIAEDVFNRFEKFENSENKFITIFNGVDCEIFKPVTSKSILRNKINLNDDHFIISYIGQFKKGKGIIDLVNACKILSQNRKLAKRLKVLFVGSVVEQDVFDELLKIIKDHNLDDLIRILPQHKEIQKIMQASDVVILPSHEGTEGMGRVLFESMACSTPVIATNVKGVREALTYETGILVDEKSPKSISEAIEFYHNNPDFLYSSSVAGRKRAKIFFDIKVHTKKVENLYYNILIQKSN